MCEDEVIIDIFLDEDSLNHEMFEVEYSSEDS